MQVYRDADVSERPAGAANFTGTVQRTDFLPRGGPDRLLGSRFRYSPGARSHWHVHERELAIIAVEGRGVVSWTGLDTGHFLLAGDWWHVAPGIEHWHGATTDDFFAHLAVTAGGGTTWLGPVSDADYLRAQPG